MGTSKLDLDDPHRPHEDRNVVVGKVDDVRLENHVVHVGSLLEESIQVHSFRVWLMPSHGVTMDMSSMFFSSTGREYGNHEFI